MKKVKLLLKKIIVTIKKQIYIIQDIFFSNKQKTITRKEENINDLVIYTAIFGGKDKLIKPKYIPQNCDFVCFTDSDFKSKIWKIRKIKPWYNDPVRNARKIKILPHKFLNEYKYSVWIDGNILLRGDVRKLIDEYLNDSNFAVHDHLQNKADPRGCVYREAEALLNLEKKGQFKDNPEIIKRQISKYRYEGYPEDCGLAVTMEVLRRHNEKDVIKVMEDWWVELKNNSRRDQLSFNYVAWKNNFKFTYIPGDSRDNEFFKHKPHQFL